MADTQIGIMNLNAMTQESTIVIHETCTGKARAGFRKTDGCIKSDADYYAAVRKNGYRVKFTANGVIIYK